MGPSPDELVAGIEHHRAELGATLGELERRLKPSHLARNAVRNNPWPIAGVLGAIGGLIAWKISGHWRDRG